MPTYLGGSRAGSPVWMPTRMRIWTSLQADHRLAHRRYRVLRAGERVEEGVSLVVHLVALAAPTRRAHHPPVLAERVAVGVRTQFVEQFGRSFDVREHQGDGPGRLRVAHRARLSLRGRRRLQCRLKSAQSWLGGRRPALPVELRPRGRPAFGGVASTSVALTLRRQGGTTSSQLPSIDDEVAVVDGDLGSARPPRGQLGGRTRREAPTWGLRPTVRFAIAFPLTVAWVAFSVWVSEPWREDLEVAVGPVMGWVIPLFLAYIPGLVIGFMVFTLLITRHRPLPLEPPAGDWPEGEWPSVTIVVAAWNERDADRPHARRASPSSRTKVAWRSSLPTTTRPTTRGCSRTEQVRGLRPRLPTCLRDDAGQAPRAEHGPRDRDDAARGDRRCRHSSAPTIARAARCSRYQQTAGSARVRVRRCARCGEPDGDLRHADAAVGLPARHQRREAHAGRLQHCARRSGCVLRLLDE